MNLKSCFLFSKFGLQFKFEQKHGQLFRYYMTISKTHDEIKIDSLYLLDEHKLLNADTLLVKSIDFF